MNKFAEKMKDEYEARKERNMYTPKPIDTANIELPSEIKRLTERLAASTHDVWAVGKIGKGYRFGEVTSDEDKTHTDLIPYEDLTEEKKDTDRQTAMETLKAIYALGYKIG